MNAKKFIVLSVLMLGTIFFQNCSEHMKEPQKVDSKPNVLFIMVDDMKDWVGYLNGYNGEVHTPNIDRLASEGMAFTNAHTSAPVCNPSRNALMLGKLPSTTGLYDNGQWWKTVYPDAVTLPQYFKEHGYYTAGAGKVFHHTPGNNPPVSWNDYKDQVFDDPWNFADWSPERYFLSYGYRGPILPKPEWKPLSGIETVRTPMDWGPIPGKVEADYGDVQAVNYAKDFLEQGHSKPFFLSVGIYKPHIPWHVPQKYFDMYPMKEVVLPEVKENDLEDVPEVGKEIAYSNKEFHEISDAGKWKEAVQAYLASISFSDARVGAIMDALEKSEYAKNTIVVLVSDHGWHLGSKSHWHKSTLWEEATRIPFVIKAPGITQTGTISDQPVDMLSVYPTLISLAGLPNKPDLEGHNITPLLKNSETEWNYPAITVYGKGNVAIRSQNWRYIRYHDGGEELYNHQEDPHEWTNLAGDQSYEDVIKEHQKWIPATFKDAVPGKNNWYFDPHEYTWLNRDTGEFIDGKK